MSAIPTQSPNDPPPQESLRESLRALPRAVWILCLGTFLNKFGTFVIPFLALYMTGLGFTARDAGIAIGAYGAGHLAACAIGGVMADRIGRRKTIIISMVSVSVSMILLSQARSFASFVWISALAGLCGELYRPACSALLADLSPQGKRVTAFAAYRMALNAGWAFGPMTAGLLANHSFFWLFIGDAATSALFAIVAWKQLPRGVRISEASVHWVEVLRQFWRDKAFLRVLAASMAVGMIFYQMSTTYGLQVAALGFSPATYGKLISFNGLLVVLLELPLSGRIARLPPRRAMAIGYLMTGAGFGLNAFAVNVPMLALGMFIFTMGEIFSMPVTSAYIADLAPGNLRGSYMGLFGLTWAAGLVFSPVASMAVFEWNPAALWMACGGLGVFAAVVISAGAGRTR